MTEKICHAQKHLSECAPPVRIIKNRTLDVGAAHSKFV